MSVQVEALSHCHLPWAGVAPLAVTTMPSTLLSVDPPLTESAVSEKLAATRLETVLPAGSLLSSETAARVAEPLKTGASFTAVTDVPRVVALDHWPVMASAVEMLVAAEKVTPVSEARTEREPGVPLKSRTLGRKRSLAVVGSRIAALLDGADPPLAMDVQVLPLSVEYSQTPSEEELAALPTMAMPPKAVAVVAPPVMPLLLSVISL